MTSIQNLDREGKMKRKNRINMQKTAVKAFFYYR